MEHIVETLFTTGLHVVKEIEKTQKQNLIDAGIMIAHAHLNGKSFYVTGSGHSHTMAEEFYGRAGGLAFTIPILTSELTLTDHPTKSTLLENLSGYAHILVELYKISCGDVVVIASNSGRNPYPVELAYEAKQRGAKVIAITNLKHSLQCSPRNIHNVRLCEVADIVIDTCGDIGDASTYIKGIDTAMFPTSSMANSFIAGVISVVCAKELANQDAEVEVFVSANVDGGFEKNEAYMEKYGRMYK